MATAVPKGFRVRTVDLQAFDEDRIRNGSHMVQRGPQMRNVRRSALTTDAAQTQPTLVRLLIGNGAGIGQFPVRKSIGIEPRIGFQRFAAGYALSAFF